MGIMSLLVFCALVINVAALVPRMPSILSYMAAPLWLLAGVQAKGLQTGANWVDMYFYLFILFSVGFTLLSIFEGISIKKVDVQLEREADKAELAGEHEENNDGGDDEEAMPSRSDRVRRRADRRRARLG